MSSPPDGPSGPPPPGDPYGQPGYSGQPGVPGQGGQPPKQGVKIGLIVAIIGGFLVVGLICCIGGVFLYINSAVEESTSAAQSSQSTTDATSETKEPTTDASSETSDSGEISGIEGDTLSQLRERSEVTVAFAAEEPYAFEEGGELKGAVIALTEKTFEGIGIDTVKFVETEWASLVPGLNAGRYDAVSAGMSILPDRCEKATFGDPEFLNTTALLVPEGNPMGLSNLADVKDSGAKLVTISGTPESAYAEELGIEGIQVSSPEDGLDAVTDGRAEVFAAGGVSLRGVAEDSDEGISVTESFVPVVNGEEQVGAGATIFRDEPEDQSLREAYNKELAKIVKDEESYEAVIGEYGFTDAERPKGDLTTEQLCAG